MNRGVPVAYIEPPPPPQQSPSTHKPKSNLPMLYYGLVVVGTAVIVLVIYNLIIIKWCTRRQHPRRRPNSGGFVEATTTASHSFDNINRNLLSSFKYRKDMSITGGQGQGQEQEQGNYEYECAVCLSVFEEGEEVRKLPRCKHSFHASCIDMWLYSHLDCPLCRAPVQLTRCLLVDSQEHSRENLLASGISPPNS